MALGQHVAYVLINCLPCHLHLKSSKKELIRGVNYSTVVQTRTTESLHLETVSLVNQNG